MLYSDVIKAETLPEGIIMVLYFSGTGNSRHAARKIAEISGDEIISINQRIKEDNYSPVTSHKPLVFVGPVYAGRLLRVMEGYIKKVAFSGKERVYFIGTCAQTPWQTVKYIEKICEQKGFSLIGFNSIVMPQGYIAGGGTQPKEVSEQILKEAYRGLANRLLPHLKSRAPPAQSAFPGTGWAISYTPS